MYQKHGKVIGIINCIFIIDDRFKALEVTYQLSLVTINKKLASIEISLSIDSFGHIVLDPTIEEIREIYLNSLKRLIKLPLEFKGCGNKSGYFKRMIGENGQYMLETYKKSEELIGKLKSWIKQFEEFTILNRVSKTELRKIIEERVNTPFEFISNFNKMKQIKQMIDDITGNYQIDCLYISTKKFKINVNSKIKEFDETLKVYLKEKIIKDFDEIIEFLKNSIRILESLPSNLNLEKLISFQKEMVEIETKRNQFKGILKNTSDFRKLFSKDDYILTEINERFQTIKSDWKSFDEMFKSYQDKLEGEKSNIASYIEKMVLFQIIFREKN